VAIKVLPPALALEPERRERFEREARTVGSLNHPHICALYDLGHQDTAQGPVDFLVMEYLEGETLGDRLAKGGLPADQAMRYAMEMAAALDQAHRHGVIHRDLKPGNVMITKSGAKLLDFGLAKLRRQGEGSGLAEASALPTRDSPLTAEGALVGTFQYMAPEQLEGRDADARTDIFALGAVIYEMAAGRKAFSGKSSASLIAAILERDPPPISSLQPLVPPPLDRVVRTCLAKDPEDRWQSAHDILQELRWIAEGALRPAAASADVDRHKRRERLAWTAASFLLIAAVVLAVRPLLRAPADRRPVRVVVPAPEKTAVRDPALSPDGGQLAFVGTGTDGKRLLFLRSLDALAARPLGGTEEAEAPFWSPDGRFIGFFAGGKLKKIEVSSGVIQPLCDAPQARGGSWNREGVIVFGRANNDGLYRVSAAGGEPARLTTVEASKNETGHFWPQFLPDGRHFLYLTDSGAVENHRILVDSLDSQETRELLRGIRSRVLYSSTGHLLFLRERKLMAQTFDARRLQTTGEAFGTVDQVGIGPDPAVHFDPFSVSQNGTLAYQAGGGTEGTELVWFDRQGKRLGSLGPPTVYAEPALSPDRKRIAVSRPDTVGGQLDIWLLDSSGGTASRFTFGATSEATALWSPDGRDIVFTWNEETGRPGSLYRKPATGGRKEELLLESKVTAYADDWSSDGRFLAYEIVGQETGVDLWILRLAPNRESFAFLATKANESQAQFSPDGRWMAYASDESRAYEVYVQPFPPTGGKWQVSTGGGVQPRWRGDGKEIFYIAPDRTLMAVEVKATPALSFSAPRALFPTRVHALTESQVRNAYLPTADGQRFLINGRLEEASTPFTLVLNWAAAVKR